MNATNNFIATRVLAFQLELDDIAALRFNCASSASASHGGCSPIDGHRGLAYVRAVTAESMWVAKQAIWTVIQHENIT